MALVPGYRHDLFISYASSEVAWVDTFTKALIAELQMRLGQQVKVWRDSLSLRMGQKWASEIEQGIRDAFGFIAIISPSYLHSAWCMRERTIVLENGLDALKVDSFYRFLKVIKTPGPGNLHEELLSNLADVRLFNPADGFELLAGSPEYASMIRATARSISELFATARNARFQLYVACNLGDMEEDRERLVLELEDRGFLVKPDVRLGPEFGRGAVRSAMENSSLVIVLLGGSFDRYIEDQIRVANQLSKSVIFVIHEGKSAHAEDNQMRLLSNIRGLRGVPPKSRVLTVRSTLAMIREILYVLEETEQGKSEGRTYVGTLSETLVHEPYAGTPSEAMARLPYPGLRAFESDESMLFFGRQAHVNQLLRHLSENPFLAVVGNSGSGKSSLVRAGLLPALIHSRLPKAKSDWRICTMRPGAKPLDNLANALAAQQVFSGDSQSILRELRRSTMGLARIGRGDGLASDENLLVIVDQFEELFRFVRERANGDWDDAKHFVFSLLEAFDPVYIILVIRSDFLGECAMFPGLPEALNGGQYLVPRLSREQFRQVIEEPLRLTGVRISPILVERLLSDLGDDPSQLSMLQHTLSRTFHAFQISGKKEVGKEVGIEDYMVAGELSGALNAHAEMLLNGLRSENPAFERWAEKVFRCLTTVHSGNRIRRPTKLDTICHITGAIDEESGNLIRKVIETYGHSNNSLVFWSGAGLDGDSVLDIAHESLIANWGRLRRWTDTEAETVRLYRVVSEDVLKDSEGEAAKWRGRTLSDALDLLASGTWSEAWADRQGENFVQFNEVMGFIERQRIEEEKEALAAKESSQKFPSCFISYSSNDDKFTSRLCIDLENNGIKCWFAPHDIEGGKKIHEQIDEAIRAYDRLLLVLSEHSLNSEWVRTEIASARRKELDQRRKVLFPIRLVPFEIIREWRYFDADIGKDSAREIREFFIPDFSDWTDENAYQEAFQRLIRDLGRPAHP